MTKKYHSPKDYLDAATSPDTPISELALLAFSEYDFVRAGVAENPNVTSEILTTLLPVKIESWNEQTLASILAENQKTPPETLAILGEKLIPVLNNERGNDYGMIAGVNLCSNPNTPFETIRVVLTSDKVATQLRRKVARETDREDVLDLLLRDRSEAVRKRAQNKMETL